MHNKKHRAHSPVFKVKVLRKHLIDKVPVSEVCEEHDIKPSVFYSWQKELFDRCAVVFESNKANASHTKYQQQIKKLESKLSQKNEVLAELMEEHIKLKKEYGEL